MEILGTITPDKIPPARYSSKKYVPLNRAIATLAPGEVLKVKMDYTTQGYLIKKKIADWFPNTKFDVITRKLGDNYYTFIHYKTKAK